MHARPFSIDDIFTLPGAGNKSSTTCAPATPPQPASTPFRPYLPQPPSYFSHTAASIWRHACAGRTVGFSQDWLGRTLPLALPLCKHYHTTTTLNTVQWAYKPESCALSDTSQTKTVLSFTVPRGKHQHMPTTPHIKLGAYNYHPAPLVTQRKANVHCSL